VKPLPSICWLLATAVVASCTTTTQSRDTPRYLLGGATPQLAAEVLPVIRTRTADAIIDLEKKADGTVEVKTGALVPYRSGGGSYYVLRKRDGRWQIVSEGVWIV
jgi:hypothetical protein